jgi:repressor LexA
MCMSGAVTRNRIRELRKERGLTQEELAARLGEDTSIATVSRLESGSMGLTHSWIDRIAQAMKISPHEIIATPGNQLRMVPVIGHIAAGAWAEAIERPEGWIPALPSVGGPNSFALKPVGDSMDQLADEESYIIVDPDQRELEIGRVYAVRNMEGEATFKRYVADPPRLMPCSNNPAHQPIPIGNEPFVIIGRVTYVSRPL